MTIIYQNLKKNIITHNEGGSIATAIGYYLAQKIAAVYLQNSGLGIP